MIFNIYNKICIKLLRRKYIYKPYSTLKITTRAPLLPKLRGHFAEFLDNPSPVGLRILFLPTCVGLRYGHLIYTSKLFSPVSMHASLLYISVPFARVYHRPGHTLPQCHLA